MLQISDFIEGLKNSISNKYDIPVSELGKHFDSDEYISDKYKKMMNN